MKKIMKTFNGTKQRWAVLLASGAALLGAVALVRGPPTRVRKFERSEGGHSKVGTGFAIDFAELDLCEENSSLVGLGSYFANAHGNCSDCHTYFDAGGNPCLAELEQNNTARDLTRGCPYFGDICSRSVLLDPARDTLAAFDSRGDHP